MIRLHQDAKEKMEEFFRQRVQDAEWLGEWGFKINVLQPLRVSMFGGKFSFEKITQTDWVNTSKGFVFVIGRQLLERTGKVSITLDPSGDIVLEPEKGLPRGCHLHLSSIARIISQQGLPPSGEPRTK